MRYYRNLNHLTNAKNLRKNMTPQERHLWYDFLRYCKPRFRRQELIGNYIVDFLCYEAQLAIEVDGSQHYEPVAQQEDQTRSIYLNSLGIQVLRFSNSDVNTKFDSVCQAILLALEQRNILPEVNIE
ncbi:MAG: endonuclease domain-containing protein [Oscillospiraceae bacterium]|nr:endonuclease domain-containing protein [Oscillospiraceae bacterium]